MNKPVTRPKETKENRRGVGKEAIESMDKWLKAISKPEMAN